jgi:protein-disulfide isomerase
MALAAAQQGKYSAYHDAMYRLGPPSKQTIEQAATESGVDLAAANKAIASGVFDSFLRSNIALADRIGINGTPGWVIGDQVIDGAVGQAALGQAIEEARRS